MKKTIYILALAFISNELYSQKLPSGYQRVSVNVEFNKTYSYRKNVTTSCKCTEDNDKDDIRVVISAHMYSPSIITPFSALGDLSLDGGMPDAELVPFHKPLTGSGNIQVNSHKDKLISDNGNCESAGCGRYREIKTFQGSSQLNVGKDLNNFMFEYNPETKRGSSHITVITSNNPSGTLKTNIQDCDGVKQETENNYSPNIVHAASILGGFTASNYKMTDVFNNLNIPGMEKMMEGMKKLDEHNKDKNYGMVNNAIITYDPQTKIYRLSASSTVTRIDSLPEPPEGCKIKGEIVTIVTTNYTVTAHVNPPKLKAYFKAYRDDSYTNWIPQGPQFIKTGNSITTRGKVGNKLRMTVEVIDEESGSIVPQSDYNIFWKLTKVSTEPGVCLNYPTQNPDNYSDIQIYKNTASNLEPSNNSLAIGGTPDCDPAVIVSYDYGGYGVLTAEIKLKTGTTRYPVMDKVTNKTSLSLPCDDNQNFVADKWEEQMGYKQENYQPDFDREYVAGNRFDGDGLSFYEEYRGLQAKGSHLRLDGGNKKHLVVINTIGNQLNPGFTACEDLAKIKIIQTNKEDMKILTNAPSMVNLNYKSYHLGDQYSVKCVKGSFPNSDEIGLAECSPIFSPKTCKEYKINQSYINSPELVLLNVPHELGHACGLKHHADNTSEKDVAGLIGGTVMAHEDLIFYDYKGDLVYSQKGAGPLPSGFKGLVNNRKSIQENYKCTGSGDPECVMAYNNYFDYTYLYNNKKLIFRMTPYGHNMMRGGTIDLTPKKFCTSKSGAKWNATTHYHGDGNEGNCFEGFRIRDF